MEQPREVHEEEHERVWERVAAVDVAKGSGVVCTRVPDEDRPGRRRSHVHTVPARSGAVIELGDYLRARQIQVVTLESTSDYWRIWFVILEAAGLRVQLVNARMVKNVPGRAKTDKNDAVWLAKLTERGMLRPSFVPPPEIRRLREFTRLRADLVHDRTRYWARMEKLLERALIKISDVMSELNCVSGRAMIEALIAGERSPRVLAGLALKRLRNKQAELIEALTGKFEDHHGELARMLLDQIDALTAQIDQLTGRITGLLEEIPAAWGVNADGSTGAGAGAGPGAAVLPAVARLDEITGCGTYAAQAVIAEIGLDMTVFGTPGRLVSWGQTLPADPPVRQQDQPRQGRQGQPLPQRHPRRDRRVRRPHRHLPRRALPADRPPPRQAQGPGRDRPLHPGHHLPPARRPRRPLPRPRPGPLRHPHRPRPQDPQPRPPAPGPWPRRHPPPPGRTRRLTRTTPRRPRHHPPGSAAACPLNLLFPGQTGAGAHNPMPPVAGGDQWCL